MNYVLNARDRRLMAALWKAFVSGVWTVESQSAVKELPRSIQERVGMSARMERAARYRTNKARGRNPLASR